MSTTATYKVVATWFDGSEVTLQVDLDVLTKELATLINEFWSDADERLRGENGDVVRAVIRLFGSVAISYFLSRGGVTFSKKQDGRYWTQAVIDAQHEGWPDFDGLGILITDASVDSACYDDVTLETV